MLRLESSIARTLPIYTHPPPSHFKHYRSHNEGQGIYTTVVIPSDPNVLVDRLNILLASKAAGNTRVRNEIVSICDEHMWQKEMTKQQYKKLMLHL